MELTMEESLIIGRKINNPDYGWGIIVEISEDGTRWLLAQNPPDSGKTEYVWIDRWDVY